MLSLGGEDVAAWVGEGVAGRGVALAEEGQLADPCLTTASFTIFRRVVLDVEAEREPGCRGKSV